MTNSRSKDISLLALAGLLIGGMLGILAAGGYATWARGGDLANIGFGTIFAFLPPSWPWSWPVLTEPVRTAAMIGGGIAMAMAVLIPAVGMRRALTSHGSARWATQADMRRAKLLSRVETLNGPVLGKTGTPRSRAAYLTSASVPHSLIAAPTGVGKGVGVVTPTLLTYPGSIVCLDMKGANYENTARHRRTMGDLVFKFAPYDPEGRTHRFNPLDAVAAADERRRFTEARRLAASFITIKGESAQGFLDGARDIFAATALLCIQRGTPTIAAVHDALSQPGKVGANLFLMGKEVRSNNARSIFNKFSSRDDKHLSAYMSILMDGGLGLWADPMVRDATAASDFQLGSLRARPASIYLVIPPNDVEPLAPLVRLIFQQAVAILQRSLPDPEHGEKYPVLMLLDEFVSLGRMDNLKAAITTLREYQVRVMLVVQTISSLRDLYGRDGAGTFVSNCGVQLFMGPADEETPDYISKAIGDFTRKTRSKSWRGGDLATSYSERIESARLIRPEQVRLLGEAQVVALVQNMLPILAHRVTYYEDRELKRIFEAQKGDYPDPPKIDPYDPIEPGPKGSPSPDGPSAIILGNPNGRTIEGKAHEVDDTGPDDVESDPKAPHSDSDHPSVVTPDPSDEDPERQRRIEGMERISVEADGLTDRLEEARRKKPDRPKRAAQALKSKASTKRAGVWRSENRTTAEQADASASASKDSATESVGSEDDTMARLLKARARNKNRMADQDP